MMDAIENLDIHLDTSDRKLYYDFVHGAIVSSPTDAKDKQPEDRGVKLGWIFKNDSHELRVAHMSRAHYLDKRFFEDFAPSKDSSIQTPELGKDDIVFGGDFSKWCYESLPHYALPIYQTGETVRGTVVLKLKKPLEAERLTINLLRRASVNVRVYHRYGYYDVTKHDEYINETISLWNSPKLSKKNDEGFSTLIPNEKDLVEGTTEFPFEFKLPVGLISSIIPMSPKSNNFTYLSYRLKATVDKGKTFGRGNAVTCRGIWVDHPSSVLDVKEGMDPIQVEESMTTGFFSSGNITCRASIPKSAYCASFATGNEEISLTLQILNNSSDNIQEVTARIRCEGRGMVGTSKISLRQGFKHYSVPCTGGPIIQGDSPTYKWNLKFDFKDAFLETCNLPSSLSSEMCKYIDFRYEVVIKLKRKGPAKNMEVCIPITVCNQNPGADPAPAYPGAPPAYTDLTKLSVK